MAKIEDLKALAADLRKRLRQVDQLTGRASERDRDALRKRFVRAATNEVQDRERRDQLEADDTAWLRYYLAEMFWYRSDFVTFDATDDRSRCAGSSTNGNHLFSGVSWSK
jgi:hypothetical protein